MDAELDGLISAFYEAALEPARWQDGLSRFADLAHARSAVSVFGDLGSGDVTILDSSGQPMEAIEAYNSHYFAHDPLVELAARTPVGVWMNDWRDAVDSGYEQGEYYNEFMRRFDNHAVMANILVQQGSLVSTISVQRGVGQPKFGGEDERRLAPVMPHVQRAARLHFTVKRAGLEGQLAAAALDGIAVPVLIVDGQARALLMNRAAEQLCRRHPVLGIRQGRLAAADAPSLEQAITHATAHGRTRASGVLLATPQPRDTLHLVVAPLAPNSTMASAWQRPLALVMALGRGQPAPNLGPLLRSLFSLTAAETRVAWLVADGHTPAEVAERLQISLTTVRTQLKAVYFKTGVRRQAELSRLLGALALSGGGAPPA